MVENRALRKRFTLNMKKIIIKHRRQTIKINNIKTTNHLF